MNKSFCESFGSFNERTEQIDSEIDSFIFDKKEKKKSESNDWSSEGRVGSHAFKASLFKIFEKEQ